MNNITKEQIERLEKIGFAIADSIAEEYNALQKSAANNEKKIKEIYSELGNIVGNINGEGNRDGE